MDSDLNSPPRGPNAEAVEALRLLQEELEREDRQEKLDTLELTKSLRQSFPEDEVIAVTADEIDSQVLVDLSRQVLSG